MIEVHKREAIECENCIHRISVRTCEHRVGGRVRDKMATEDEGRQIAGLSWFVRTCVRCGNMTTIPRPGLNRPSWANLTTDQWSALTADQWAEMEVAPTFKATYDAWNRLVKLTDGGNGETVQENQYDGRGYRIVTKTYTDGILDETRHAYFTDQWQCIEERLGTSSTPDRHFIWGIRYIDDLILRDRSVSGGTLNERLYSMQDANWNVTAVVDSTGTVQERYEYDPYGITTILSPNFAVRSTSIFAWEITYCGYRWDTASGLFAVRNRFYHPRVGVWLTRDALGYVAGMSLQSYLSVSPTTHTDPFGLNPYVDTGEGYSRGPDYAQQKGTYTCDFSSAFTDYLWFNPGASQAHRNTLNPFNWDPSGLRQKWGQGCVGVTSCWLGFDPRGKGLDDCYDTFARAQQIQKQMNKNKTCETCCGKNINGQPSQARIIEFMWLENQGDYNSLNNPRSFDNQGKMNWNDSRQSILNRFDFHYYQDATNTWWGAQDAERIPGKQCTFMTPQDLSKYLGAPAVDNPPWNKGNRWLKVFCVTCERDTLLR